MITLAFELALFFNCKIIIKLHLDCLKTQIVTLEYVRAVLFSLSSFSQVLIAFLKLFTYEPQQLNFSFWCVIELSYFIISFHVVGFHLTYHRRVGGHP